MKKKIFFLLTICFCTYNFSQGDCNYFLLKEDSLRNGEIYESAKTLLLNNSDCWNDDRKYYSKLAENCYYLNDYLGAIDYQVHQLKNSFSDTKELGRLLVYLQAYDNSDTSFVKLSKLFYAKNELLKERSYVDYFKNCHSKVNIANHLPILHQIFTSDAKGLELYYRLYLNFLSFSDVSQAGVFYNYLMKTDPDEFEVYLHYSHILDKCQCVKKRKVIDILDLGSRTTLSDSLFRLQMGFYHKFSMAVEARDLTNYFIENIDDPNFDEELLQVRYVTSYNLRDTLLVKRDYLALINRKFVPDLLITEYLLGQLYLNNQFSEVLKLISLYQKLGVEISEGMNFFKGMSLFFTGSFDQSYPYLFSCIELLKGEELIFTLYALAILEGSNGDFLNGRSYLEKIPKDKLMPDMSRLRSVYDAILSNNNDCRIYESIFGQSDFGFVFSESLVDKNLLDIVLKGTKDIELQFEIVCDPPR